MFEDKAPGCGGSRIYHRLIPDAEAYISQQARTGLHTLYAGPSDRITRIHHLHDTLEDSDGVSAKRGGNGEVSIFYSPRHIEKLFENNDEAEAFFEIRGVFLHELTHVYQLESQGISSYGTRNVFRAFIGGMADAVRLVNGGFSGEAGRPRGGSYMEVYRYEGYFFVWLRDDKDPEFLRKFNQSALEAVSWSI